MANVRIASRYAEALLQEAQSLNVLDIVRNDLIAIKAIIKQSNEFRLFLKSPIIKKEKKNQFFIEAFSHKVNMLTLKFLLLLVEKERESLLSAIIDSFSKLWEEASGIANVLVKSAVELDSKQQDKLKKRFEELTKKKVHVQIEIDKNIIGGFIASIDDTMFDASVNHQLNVFYKKLVS